MRPSTKVAEKVPEPTSKHLPTPSSNSDYSANSAPNFKPLTDIIKSDCDDCKYGSLTLSNGLEAVVISDPRAVNSGAFLRCAVGSLDDEFAGQSLMLSKLLPKGKTTFPEQDAFEMHLASNRGYFISEHGDSFTSYGFGVDSSTLCDSLRLFGRIFADPLIPQSSMESVLKAVGDHYREGSQDDKVRLDRLDRSTSCHQHPYSYFPNDSIDDTIQKLSGDSKLREKLVKFFKTNYSAKHMTLAVLGPESLDVLSQWVTHSFSDISAHKVLPSPSEKQEPYRKEEFGTMCFAKSVSGFHGLRLQFLLTDKDSVSGSQADKYITHLLTHNGPNGIMAYVRDSGWILDITARVRSICKETSNVLEIEVELTKDGHKDDNYIRIVGIILQYIKKQRSIGPQKCILEEIFKAESQRFKWQEKMPAISLTQQLSRRLQAADLPHNRLLCGYPELQIKTDGIDEIMAEVKLENMRMMIMSPNLTDTRSYVTESWYGTDYHYGPVSPEILSQLHKILQSPDENILKQLGLPPENEFLSGEVELIQEEEATPPSEVPVQLLEDDTMRVWCCPKYGVPKAVVSVLLRYRESFTSAEIRVEAQLFVMLLLDELQESCFNARLAGFIYTVQSTPQGLVIRIEGYTGHDNIVKLLERILQSMRNLRIKEEGLCVVKEELKAGLEKWQVYKPAHQVGDYLKCLNTEGYQSVEERRAALAGVNADRLRIFRGFHLSKMHMELSVQGNITEKWVLSVSECIRKALNPCVLPQSYWPSPRSLDFPLGSNYVHKMVHASPHNTINCVGTWLYAGDRGNRQIRLKLHLIVQIMRRAVVQLRAKSQIDFIANLTVLYFDTTCGLKILIEGNDNTEHLDYCIETFLQQTMAYLRAMSDSEVEEAKKSLITERLDTPKRMHEIASDFWTDILSGYYDFLQPWKDATSVGRVAKQELLDLFKERFDPASSSTRVRLSVHIIALSSSQEQAKMTSVVRQAQKITDLGEFKRGLRPTPAPRSFERPDSTSYDKDTYLPSIYKCSSIGALLRLYRVVTRRPVYTWVQERWDADCMDYMPCGSTTRTRIQRVMRKIQGAPSFIVRYRTKEGVRTTYIDFQSTELRNEVAEACKGVSGISLVGSNTMVRLSEFLFQFNSLHQHLLSGASDAPEQVADVLRFLDKALKTPREQLTKLGQGDVSFDLIPYRFAPGAHIYMAKGDDLLAHHRCAILDYCEEKVLAKQRYMVLLCHYIDWNGQEFAYYSFEKWIPFFVGSRKIFDLPAYPLDCHPKEKVIRKELIDNGKRLLELPKVKTFRYRGFALTPTAAADRAGEVVLDDIVTVDAVEGRKRFKLLTGIRLRGVGSCQRSNIEKALICTPVFGGICDDLYVLGCTEYLSNMDTFHRKCLGIDDDSLRVIRGLLSSNKVSTADVTRENDDNMAPVLLFYGERSCGKMTAAISLGGEHGMHVHTVDVNELTEKNFVSGLRKSFDKANKPGTILLLRRADRIFDVEVDFSQILTVLNDLFSNFKGTVIITTRVTPEHKFTFYFGTHVCEIKTSKKRRDEVCNNMLKDFGLQDHTRLLEVKEGIVERKFSIGRTLDSLRQAIDLATSGHDTALQPFLEWKSDQRQPMESWVVSRHA